MRRKHSWTHLPHPGPDPSVTKTLRELFDSLGDGSLLSISQGRLPPRPTPRTRVQLADELADILVHTEVFKRAWWDLRPDLRDAFWRCMDALYRAGGIARFKDIVEPPTAQELHELECAGMLYPIPSAVRPVTLAIPYEWFFMPDMPGTGPRSLCQALRHYSDAGARVLAVDLGLRETLPRAAALARLHRKLIEASSRLSENLAPQAMQLLEFVARRGGVIAARSLSDRVAQIKPEWALRLPLSADDLLGARFNPNSPVQMLARRALLAPCGEPGWSAFPQVVIPEELREAACAKVSERANKALAAERKSLGVRIANAHPDARPGQFATDLRRLATVTHLEKLDSQKGGKVGKAARARLEGLLHLSTAELDELLGFAARREAAGSNLEGETTPQAAQALESFQALPMVEQTRALAEDFLGPAGWLRDFRKHLVSILVEMKEQWAPLDALSKHVVGDPVAISAWETAHSGEVGPAEDVWIRARVAADLRTLHRLGFAERASGATQEAWRLAKASSWALLGKKPPPSATRASRTAPDSETGFAVLPTMEILASPAGGMALLSALSRVARLERADAAFVFRLDKKSVAAGLNEGMSVEEIREFLEKHSRNPLPDTVRFMLADLGGESIQVVWDEPAGLLRCADPMVLLKLRRTKWLKPWILEAGPEGALKFAPEAACDELVARLAKEGFVVGRK
ncbi:MAG: helicase-associated domain-containing protein [Planctomycetes bacterium]|nr:helicase-associated domain-containing protein [Planctomycetota bacterium]